MQSLKGFENAGLRASTTPLNEDSILYF